MNKATIGAVRDALRRVGTSRALLRAGEDLLSVTTKLLAAVLILYSGYVVYDTNYIEKQAFVSQDLLQYRPSIIDDANAPPDANTLAAVNRDYRGWLTLYDTRIDYPFMQADNDVYYVSHDVYKEASLSGAIYLAAANTRDGTDSYNLMYGHHMDNGSMFGGLDLYVDEAYLNAHRRGVMVAESDVYDLRVFALVRTDAYEGKLYSAGSRMDAVLSYLRKPDQKTKVLLFDEAALGNARQILALSTCMSDATNGRLVLFLAMFPRGMKMPETRLTGSNVEPTPVREPEEPPRNVRYVYDPDRPEELLGIDEEGEPTGATYVYDPDSPGELLEMDEEGEPTGARFILDPEHPGELREIADKGAPLDWRSTYGSMSPEELAELLDKGVPPELLSACGALRGSNIACYAPCYIPYCTPCCQTVPCAQSAAGRNDGCGCGGAACTGACGGGCGGSASCGGKAGGWLDRFQPAGTLRGRAWALVNLIVLLVTAYLLLPFLHIKAKFGRARVMARINAAKKELFEAVELDDQEALEKTMIELYATAENARAEGESVKTALRAAKAAAFADVTEDEFAEATDALFYQIAVFTCRFRVGLALEILLAAHSLVTFLLTEDLRLPMTLVDRWTPLMLLYLALCWTADVWLIRYRGRVRAEDDKKLRRAAKKMTAKHEQN